MWTRVNFGVAKRHRGPPLLKTPNNLEKSEGKSWIRYHLNRLAQFAIWIHDVKRMVFHATTDKFADETNRNLLLADLWVFGSGSIHVLVDVELGGRHGTGYSSPAPLLHLTVRLAATNRAQISLFSLYVPCPCSHRSDVFPIT